MNHIAIRIAVGNVAVFRITAGRIPGRIGLDFPSCELPFLQRGFKLGGLHSFESRVLKPSEAVQLHRETIRQVVIANQACNPRIFGSVLHGEDSEGSDIDLLVDPIDGKTSLVSLARIKRELDQILGFSTDIQTPRSLHERFRAAILQEAVPV